MSEEIFRKKSLDKIKSPESLNDMIRVANPGVWLLIVAVILLLLGAGVWGIFGHMDSTVEGYAFVENGEAAFFVESGAKAETIPQSVIATVDGEEYTFEQDPIYDGELPEKAAENDLVFIGKTAVALPDGVYRASVVTERIRPITFVLN